MLSLFSDEREHKWKNDKKIRSVVEAGAFRLLSQLSGESLKGRKLIFEATGFQHAIARAKNVLSSWSRPDESGDKYTQETKPLKQESNTNKNHMDLLIAALSYVATMTQVSEACSLFLNDEDWIQVVVDMAKSGISTDLQIEALKTISSLVRCPIEDGCLHVGRVGEIFQGVLREEHSPQAEGSSRENEVYSLVTEGMLFLFDAFPVEQQKSLVSDAAARYRKLLKSHTIHRTNKNGSGLEHGGKVAYNITSIIMIASCNLHLEDVLDSNLIMSLVNTVQWRYDPKTAVEKAEQCSWDASVTQVLQILSRIVFQVDGIFKKAEFSLQELTEVVLMVARPGKAPRQAISFSHALEEAQKVGEPASKLAARRIARNLEG